ncbi:hypothetical protein F0562_016599 [Nyssa sinensis]|uniref:RRM domain-containing protein n=1 Tax=Nyssa sinensis TaxID=561372 RepID=A0A5J4ZEW5_9ASTE|nr:hypothetical protein F0562_016599 [Nyssa sinensis]
MGKKRTAEESEEQVDEDEEEEKEDDEGSVRGSLRKLLEPFGKDEIIEFVVEAAVNHRSVVTRINQLAEPAPLERKIFVPNLSIKTTNEQVLSVFKQYGEIEECKLFMERGKCHVFLLFKTLDGAQKALKQPQKMIGDRMARCRLAPARPVEFGKRMMSVQVASAGDGANAVPSENRIFVHGINRKTTTEQVLSVFKQYGEIEECKLVNNRGKAYGFVHFKTRDGALKALEQPRKIIRKRMTSCQLASAGTVPNLVANSKRKIYVYNVGRFVNPDKLRSFFAKFGEIEEGPLGLDPVFGKFNGFAIFVYKTVEGCKKALEEPIKVFEGRQLQCLLKGRQTKKNKRGVLGASSCTAAMKETDSNTPNYNVDVNPGILNPSVNPAVVLMGQSPGIGLANQVNPGTGLANPVLASASNHTGLAPSVANGLSASNGVTPSLGFSGNYGINIISPSVIGSYGFQAALLGLGAFQNTQSGQSSAGATAAAAVRTQSGFEELWQSFRKQPAFGIGTVNPFGMMLELLKCGENISSVA